MTAVDGATLITDSYDLLALGPRSYAVQAGCKIAGDPYRTCEDATPMIADPAQIGEQALSRPIRS